MSGLQKNTIICRPISAQAKNTPSLLSSTGSPSSPGEISAGRALRPPAILDLAEPTGIRLAHPPVVRNSLYAQRTKCPSEGENYRAECGGRYDQERALRRYVQIARWSGRRRIRRVGPAGRQDARWRLCGTYSCSGGKWKGEPTTREHKPELITQLFARKVVTMGFTGTYSDEGAEFEATALVGKRSARLHVIFELLIAD
jgi:hypothetical protein